MMVEAGRFCVNLRPKASSPKASSAKASSAEGHLSWNVRIIFVLVGLLFPLLCCSFESGLSKPILPCHS